MQKKMRYCSVFIAFSQLALLSSVLCAPASPQINDPCAKIGGLQFVIPAEAIACQKSFPFNETLRQNVLTTVSRVFDFYTFEDFYLNSPPPFQESTTNIRADLARLNSTKYEVCALIMFYCPFTRKPIPYIDRF